MVDWEKCLELRKRYRERFGENMSLPFDAPGIDEWTDDRFYAQMEKCLEDGLPFDDSNPDFPWPGIYEEMNRLAVMGCAV